jgi:hypothetical protein
LCIGYFAVRLSSGSVRSPRAPGWVETAIAAAIVVTAAGCGGPGNVRLDHEACYIDGRPASLQEVEEREAFVGHRIASRQPWLVGITIVVVSLAGISYVERLVLLFSASRNTRSVGDRFREVIERYRTQPVRYFCLVGGTFGLLLMAGGLYIYFDADKRSSERALGTLQFCHLALRTGEEKRALDDQRRNLTSIHETAAEIRQLIDTLPPAEQAKAHEIVGHMDEAVRREGHLVADRLQRAEDAAQAIRDGTQSIARDLTGLEDRIDGLKELPATLHGIGGTLDKLDARATAGDQALLDVGNKLATVQRTVDALAGRPPLVCPACVCKESAVASTGGRADGSAN